MLPLGGSTIALDGDRVAVASAARLAVWSSRGNGQRLGEADAPWPAPGRPRFLGNRVLWGPGVLDLDSGVYAALESGRPETWPGGGERPQLYAWSVRGDRLLVSSSTGDSSRPARIVLLNGETGQPLSTLWHGSGPAPHAGWVGRRAVVVGFNDPRVFDVATGDESGRVALGGGTIARIDADDDDRRIVAVDLNRSIVLIDPDTWLVIDRWEGRWQDAAMAPDGRFVAALDFEGTLQFASLAAGRFQPIGDAAAPPDAASIGLTRDAIGLTGSRGAARAALAVDIS